MDWIDAMFYEACAGYFNDIFAEGLGETLMGYLNITGGNLADIYSETGKIAFIFNALVPIGAMMVIIYFFLSLADKAIKELASIEGMIKNVLTAVVALIVLVNGYSFVHTIVGIGDEVLMTVNDALDNDTDENSQMGIAKLANTYGLVYNTNKGKAFEDYDRAEDNANTVTGLGLPTDANGNILYGCEMEDDGTLDNSGVPFEDVGLGVWVGGFITLFFYSIVSALIEIIALAACMGRLIEVAVYLAVAPIGMANMFGEGLHSTGVKYLKKLLAISLQGVMIACVCRLGIIMTSTIGVGNLAIYFALSFAQVTAVFKASSWANDLVL